LRKELAIIFDVFGHPNQPYLSAFYQHLKSSRSFDTYAHKIMGATDDCIFPIRCSSKKEKLAHLIQYIASHNYRNTALKEYLLHPILMRNQYNALHFLNAQQYPALQKVIDAKHLAFSFRGYETLVRPQEDTIWKSSLLDIYKQARLLHFVSDHIQQAAIELGASEDKCRVIYRSVDTDYFKTRRQQERSIERILILSTGRLTWQKGYFFALEAMKKLMDSKLRFEYHILGEGSDLQELLFHRERLGLNQCVFFHGQQSREQVKTWLERANIYLHASLTEALPNAILEASAMELPIVATSAGGIPEAVQENQSAFLVPLADPLSIAEALHRLIASATLREQFGKAGRSYMVSKFHPDRETEDWMKFYDELLK